jgi:hypothetical protein
VTAFFAHVTMVDPRSKVRVHVKQLLNPQVPHCSAPPVAAGNNQRLEQKNSTRVRTKDARAGVEVVHKHAGGTDISVITEATGIDNVLYSCFKEQGKTTQAAAALPLQQQMIEQMSTSGALFGRVPNVSPWLCAAEDQCPLDKNTAYEAQYLCTVCCKAMHGALCGSLLSDDRSSCTYLTEQKVKTETKLLISQFLISWIAYITRGR